MAAAPRGLRAPIRLTIAGVDRTAVVAPGTVRLQNSLGNQASLSFTLRDKEGGRSAGSGGDFRWEVTSTFAAPEIGQAVVLDELSGDPRDVHFAGTIDTVEEQGMGDLGIPGIAYVCTCIDWQLYFNRLYARKIIPGAGTVVTSSGGDWMTETTYDTTAGSIVRAFINDGYRDDGWPLSDEGITEGEISDGISILTATVFDYKPLGDAMNELAQASGFSWWIDTDKKLHFREREEITAPIPIDDNGNFRSYSIKRTRQNYANEVFLRFSRTALAREQETFLGDGGAKTFSLAKPLADKPDVYTNAFDAADPLTGAVSQTVGIAPEADNPGSQWYWSYGSTEIAQADADAALGPDKMLIVVYDALFADVIGAVNYDAIADRNRVEGGSGKYQRLVEKTDLVDAGVLQGTVDAILAKLSVLDVALEVETDFPGYRSGGIVTVNLTKHGLSTDMLITSLEGWEVSGQMRWKFSAVGTEHPGGWQDYWRELAAGGGTGGGGIGIGGQDYDEAVWCINKALVTGDNSTNYHHCRRNGSPYEAFAAVKTVGSSDAVIDVLDEGGASIFGATKLTIPAGVAFGIQNTFADPRPAFHRLDRLNLNVTVAGGFGRVQITVKYR
jgi:hypothetical protein